MKSFLKIPLTLITILAILIVGVKTFSSEDDWICVNGEWIKHGNPSAKKPTSFCEKSCTSDSECETPFDFLVQSNCPFGSACINKQCRVICQLITDCQTDSDCDCSWRGDRTLDCLCLKSGCVSVEA